MAAAAEESVDFLCQKFTRLFEQLQKAEQSAETWKHRYEEELGLSWGGTFCH